MEGTVLAAIPFNCCCSPVLALASPWGKRLAEHVSTYRIAEKDATLVFSQDSALMLAQCALSGVYPSPMHDYLQYISPDVAGLSTKNIREMCGRCLTEREAQKVSQLMRMKREVIAQVQLDLRGSGLSIPFETLVKADEICESRCLDVPRSESVFGGPAFIPVADLINHDSKAANVMIYLDATPNLRATVTCRNGVNAFLGDIATSHCPFYVVVRASRHVAAQEEFTYNYLDPVSDAALYYDRSYWASKFFFVPFSSSSPSSSSSLPLTPSGGIDSV